MLKSINCIVSCLHCNISELSAWFQVFIRLKLSELSLTNTYAWCIVQVMVAHWQYQTASTHLQTISTAVTILNIISVRSVLLLPRLSSTVHGHIIHQSSSVIQYFCAILLHARHALVVLLRFSLVVMCPSLTVPSLVTLQHSLVEVCSLVVSWARLV